MVCVTIKEAFAKSLGVSPSRLIPPVSFVKPEFWSDSFCSTGPWKNRMLTLAPNVGLGERRDLDTGD